MGTANSRYTWCIWDRRGMMRAHGSAKRTCRQCDARTWLSRPRHAEVLALYNDGTTAILCAEHAAQGPAHDAVLLELADQGDEGTRRLTARSRLRAHQCSSFGPLRPQADYGRTADNAGSCHVRAES